MRDSSNPALSTCHQPFKRGTVAAAVFAVLCRALLWDPSAPSAWLHYYGCGLVGILTAYAFVWISQVCEWVVFSFSGLFFPGDVIRYFNGTQMMENQQGFLVPYSTSAMSFTVVYGTPQNFNCASLFTNLAGITQTQAYEATFVVVGGYAGSCAVVNLVYMQNANSSGLSITSSVGNGSGSLTVSVSGTTITMTNSDGISGQNSPVKITLTSLKLIA